MGVFRRFHRIRRDSRGGRKRELFEEMGLIADELEFFMINSGEETHYTYPNGDEVYNVEIIYICRKYHGNIKRQEEEDGGLRIL